MTPLSSFSSFSSGGSSGGGGGGGGITQADLDAAIAAIPPSTPKQRLWIPAPVWEPSTTTLPTMTNYLAADGIAIPAWQMQPNATTALTTLQFFNFTNCKFVMWWAAKDPTGGNIALSAKAGLTTPGVRLIPGGGWFGEQLLTAADPITQAVYDPYLADTRMTRLVLNENASSGHTTPYCYRLSLQRHGAAGADTFEDQALFFGMSIEGV